MNAHVKYCPLTLDVNVFIDLNRARYCLIHFKRMNIFLPNSSRIDLDLDTLICQKLSFWFRTYIPTEAVTAKYTYQLHPNAQYDSLGTFLGEKPAEFEIPNLIKVGIIFCSPSLITKKNSLYDFTFRF